MIKLQPASHETLSAWCSAAQQRTQNNRCYGSVGLCSLLTAPPAAQLTPCTRHVASSVRAVHGHWYILKAEAKNCRYLLSWSGTTALLDLKDWVILDPAMREAKDVRPVYTIFMASEWMLLPCNRDGLAHCSAPCVTTVMRALSIVNPASLLTRSCQRSLGMSHNFDQVQV